MDEEYLAHHGIKGQSWGVRHGPPYPVERGSGGKPKTTSVVRSKLKAAADNREEVKKAKQDARKEAVKAAIAKRAEKAAEKKAEEHEALKQRAVKDPRTLYKNKNEFTRDEIESLIRDIDFDRKIKDVRVAEVKRRIESYNRFGDVLATTSKILTNSKNAWNVIADVQNALIATGKMEGKPMPHLGSGDSKKDGDKKK